MNFGQSNHLMRKMRYVQCVPVSTVASLARALPLLLPLALVAPMAVASPAAAAELEAGDDDEKDYDFGAKVRIELRMENGDTVKHRGEIRSFGTLWTFEFDGADHHHVVTLDVAGEEGDKEFDVTLSYNRDGMDVIAPYTDTYRARKRQTLWTTDGKLAIALTVIPTKFEREDTSRKDKIKPDDTDDPLGPNLFK